MPIDNAEFAPHFTHLAAGRLCSDGPVVDAGVSAAASAFSFVGGRIFSINSRTLATQGQR